MSSGRESKIASMLAYGAIILIGAALAITWILGLFGGDAPDLTHALRLVAWYLAVIVVALYSFYFAQRQWDRKKKIWMILWIIAVVLIVLAEIFNII